MGRTTVQNGWEACTNNITSYKFGECCSVWNLGHWNVISSSDLNKQKGTKLIFNFVCLHSGRLKAVAHMI